MSLERCPKCDHLLGAPLKSSGRQVCGRCGWLSHSRQSRSPERSPRPTDPDSGLSDVEIQRLLKQATQESQMNMRSALDKAGKSPIRAVLDRVARLFQ